MGTVGAKSMPTVSMMGKGTSHITVSVRLLEAMARWVVPEGDAVAAILERVGVSREMVADADGRVSLDAEVRLWDLLSEYTGDACIGLRCAELVDIDAYGAWGFTVTSSGTVRGAIETSNAFFRLLHDVAEWEIEQDGDTATLTYLYRGTTRDPHPHAVALALGGTVQLMRRMAWAEWSPRRVHIAHPAPADEARYREHFGAPVDFDAASNALVLDAAHLDQRLTTADAGLHAVLRRHAQQRLAELDEMPERVVLQVRAVLTELLPSGEPSIEGVARQLGVSQRTLQRRLSTADTTFAGVLEETRREMAISLLQRESLGMDEVASLLGYSDGRAFRRAFKRWTNESPSEFRKRP